MKSMKTLKSVLSGILLIGPSLAFAQPVAQGSFGIYTYVAIEAPGGITWSNAEADAVAMGGQLASVTSAGVDHFIYSLVSSNASLWAREGGNPNGAGIGPWLGGYKQAGSWYWSDGSSFGYSNWSPGEPNDFGGNENYIEFYSSTGSLMNDSWNDYPNNTPDPNHLGPNPQGYVVEILNVPEVSMTNLFLLGAVVFVISYFKRGATGDRWLEVFSVPRPAILPGGDVKLRSAPSRTEDKY